MQNWLNQHQTAPYFIFPVFLIIMFLVVPGMLSYVDGWALLARRYRAESDFVGDSWRMQSGRMRWNMNFNNSLTIGSSPIGLYLAVLPVFRFKHPPLLIPWEEISISRQKGLLFEYVQFKLGRELGIPLRIRARLADEVKAAAGGRWPIESIG